MRWPGGPVEDNAGSSQIASPGPPTGGSTSARPGGPASVPNDRELSRHDRSLRESRICPVSSFCSPYLCTVSVACTHSDLRSWISSRSPFASASCLRKDWMVSLIARSSHCFRVSPFGVWSVYCRFARKSKAGFLRRAGQEKAPRPVSGRGVLVPAGSTRTGCSTPAPQ